MTPDEPAPGDLTGIDFSTLVLSLATSALVHMGLAPNPEGGATESRSR